MAYFPRLAYALLNSRSCLKFGEPVLQSIAKVEIQLENSRSSHELLEYFLPSEVLFTRVVLAFLTLLIVYPHHLKLENPKQEVVFAGASLFGIVLYFMLENTALTLTYASNVGIIVACAPFL